MNNTKNLRILALRECFSWMGVHSGYDLLFKQLQEHPSIYLASEWRKRKQYTSFALRTVSFLLRSSIGKTPYYDIFSFISEINAIRQISSLNPSIIHIAYIEENLGLFARKSKRKSYKLVGTIHQPLSWWKQCNVDPAVLNRFDLILALGEKQAKEFAPYAPGKVHFLRHGADTDFFQPLQGKHQMPSPPRVVFCGKWLRDLTTLRETVEIILNRRPDIRFSLIIQDDGRGNSPLQPLKQMPQVEFLSKISDQEMLAIYQSADVALLPLLDCTANNALLETVSCGLPLVTTDVGCIRDYARDDFSCLRPRGDSEGMASDLLRLLDSPEEWLARSQKAREFAVKHLRWSSITQQMLELYQQLLQEPANSNPKMQSPVILKAP